MHGNCNNCNQDDRCKVHGNSKRCHVYDSTMAGFRRGMDQVQSSRADDGSAVLEPGGVEIINVVGRRQRAAPTASAVVL